MRIQRNKHSTSLRRLDDGSPLEKLGRGSNGFSLTSSGNMALSLRHTLENPVLRVEWQVREADPLKVVFWEVSNPGRSRSYLLDYPKPM